VRKVFFVSLMALLLTVGLVATGCGPSCTEKELGTVVDEVPEVPGSDQTFVLPPLDPDAEPATPARPPGPAGPPVDEPSEE
jgi:hypothetical protein